MSKKNIDIKNLVDQQVPSLNNFLKTMGCKFGPDKDNSGTYIFEFDKLNDDLEELKNELIGLKGILNGNQISFGCSRIGAAYNSINKLRLKNKRSKKPNKSKDQNVNISKANDTELKQCDVEFESLVYDVPILNVGQKITVVLSVDDDGSSNKNFEIKKIRSTEYFGEVVTIKNKEEKAELIVINGNWRVSGLLEPHDIII